MPELGGRHDTYNHSCHARFPLLKLAEFRKITSKFGIADVLDAISNPIQVVFSGMPRTGEPVCELLSSFAILVYSYYFLHSEVMGFAPCKPSTVEGARTEQATLLYVSWRLCCRDVPFRHLAF